MRRIVSVFGRFIAQTNYNKHKGFPPARRVPSIPAQGNDGSAPAAGFSRGVRERFHVRGARQHPAHGFALHANAPSMNNSQRMKPEPARFFEILLHDASISRGGIV